MLEFFFIIFVALMTEFSLKQVVLESMQPTVRASSERIRFVQIILKQWKIVPDLTDLTDLTGSCGWPAYSLAAGYVKHMYSNILCVPKQILHTLY